MIVCNMATFFALPGVMAGVIIERHHIAAAERFQDFFLGHFSANQNRAAA
jgi:hypothetical protein